MRLFLSTLFVLLLAPQAVAQEAPPEQVPDVLSSGIRPDAFYFFDKEGSRLMWPDMTFEKLDRMVKAESGFVQATKPYTFEGISITGTAADDRAELSITVKLNVSPTPGQSIVVPLRMEGFHQTSPADVTGVEEYGMDLSLEQGGYLLWVCADQPRKVEVRMRAVTQVSSDSGAGIDFHLPAASTNVSLAIRGDDLSASVVGRGDEVVRASPGGPGETTVDLEGSGGSFTLNWRQQDGRRPSDQVLEVDNLQRITWDDPQAPPSVAVELNVHNRRGNIGPFEVVLPEGAELVEPLPSAAGTPLVVRATENGRIQVSPNDAEQSSRAKVAIEYRLPAADYHDASPLRILPVEIPNAVRQSGEIKFEIDQNYRLRWLQRPNVRSATRSASTDPPEVRVYLFQYDRVAFELPVWLAAKQQRLRVQQDYVIRVNETAATLEGRITAAGTIIEGVPLIVNAPGWQTTRVEDLENGTAIEGFLGGADTGLELELGELTAGANSSVGVRWTAVLPFGPEDDRLALPVPTVGSVDDRTIFVSPGTLSIVAEEGLGVVSDTGASQGLSQLPADPVAGETGEGPLRFRVQSVGTAPMFHGFLIENPPEATIDAGVELVTEAGQLRIANDWTVTPQVSLRGQLAVNLGRTATVDDGTTTTTVDTEWDVTVNGQRASLRRTDDETLVIFSNQLNGAPGRVRISTSVPLPAEVGHPAEPRAVADLVIPLPRPAFQGGTLAGPVRTQIIDAPGLDVIVGDDRVATGSAEPFTAAAVMVVRVQSRTPDVVEHQVVDRAVMRSEIGRTRRFDRLVARVVGGGDALTVDHPGWLVNRSDTESATRVFVDGVEVLQFLQSANAITIPLPATGEPHVVDVRMWRGREGNLAAGLAQPVFHLPVSAGKTYWDVVLPTDRHLLWTSSGTGELMRWRYSRLFVQRLPTRSYADLMAWVGGPPPPEPQGGNRYLLVSSDPGGLKIFEAGRPLLWLVIGSIVLATSALLFYLPKLRHPMVGIVAAVIVAGLAWLAPDLAVITGQLVLAALLLVALMAGIRTIMTGRPRATVLGGIPDGPSDRSASARRGASAVEPGSTRLHDALPSGSAAGVQS